MFKKQLVTKFFALSCLVSCLCGMDKRVEHERRARVVVDGIKKIIEQKAAHARWVPIVPKDCFLEPQVQTSCAIVPVPHMRPILMNQAVIARQIEIWEQMVGRKREFSALDLLVDAVAKKESKY